MSMVYSGDSIQDTDGGVLRPISSVMRNRIINGDCRIDQRNAGAAISTSGSYPVDRFYVVEGTSATFTAQRSTAAPAGFNNSLLFTVGTGATAGAAEQVQVRQAIEGFNIADLNWGTANAKTVTISFWVRSSLTGTYCVFLQDTNAALSYVAEYTISAANTWESKSITIAGPTTGTFNTTNDTGVMIGWDLGSGSNFNATAGTWQSAVAARRTTSQANLIGTSSATWQITGVQLEVGTQATSYEYENFGVTLQKCQRYFCKTFNYATAPAQNIGAAGSIGFISQAVQPWDAMWRFPVEMRVLPSTIVTFSTNQAGANWSLNTDAPTATPLNIGSSGLAIRASTPGAAGRGYSLHATASAEL